MDIIRICILVGSARTGSNSNGISKWVKSELETVMNNSSYNISQHDIVIIDPHTKPHPVNPVLDETIPAMIQNSTSYSSQEVRDWSEFIQSCNALVIVTPQYNWGYPSTVKGAIDVLYFEWRQKPAAIVTFGGHGGGKCDDQLRQVMRAVKMDVVEQRVQITLPELYIRGNQRTDEHDSFLAEYKEPMQLALQQLIDKIKK